jgi:hypothetical protein
MERENKDNISYFLDFINKWFEHYISFSCLLYKAYLFSKQILWAQSRNSGGRRISENSYSLDDLEIGPGKWRVHMCEVL